MINAIKTNHIIRIIEDFLSQKISYSMFLKQCNHLYFELVRTSDFNYDLEWLKVSHLLHGFLSMTNEKETKEYAEECYKILCGHKTHTYSFFLRFQNEADALQQYAKKQLRKEIVIEDMNQIFSKPIQKICKIQDLLWNQLYELCVHYSIDCDNYNSAGTMALSRDKIVEKIARILRYSAGEEEMLLYVAFLLKKESYLLIL